MITDQELDKGLLTMKSIWFAMLMSVVIYLFVGLYVEPNFRSPMEKDAFAILRNVLYGVAFIMLIATRYVRRLILSGKGKYQQSSQTSQHPALQRYSIAMIAATAMSEAIAIFGLILYFLGKNRMDLYLLILVSALAIFMYRPRRDEVINLTRDGQEDLSTGGAIS
ncbi:MAG: hypothetical protein Q7J31_15610 [Syntrophales bacterium]|nr:hypothetical protein [Syntrophales bacterium]